MELLSSTYRRKAKNMNASTIAGLIKGSVAYNAHGPCAIHHNAEAKQIATKGYALINCSSAYRNQARVDWLGEGSFRSSPVMGRNKALWFARVKFGGFDKKLKAAGYSVPDILANLSTDGYTGQYICVQVKKGNTPNAKKVESMRVAAYRHAETNYDDVDKRGMTDPQVRDLRRVYSVV